MFNEIIIKNKVIKVVSQLIFYNDKRKTLLINKKYILASRDKIKYCCDNCHKEYIQYFKYKEKFFNFEKLLCRNCSISYNNAFKNEDVKEKIKQINFKRYGVEYTSQIESVKLKKENTLLKNYGVKNPSQSKEIQNKIKKTNLEKYGVEYILQDKIKMKKGMMKKYGVEHPLQLKLFHDKSKSTCFKNYGTKYPAQNKIIHNKTMSSFQQSTKLKQLSETLHYQTKPELDFISWCETNKINIWDGPSIPYNLNGKEHIYHIDFETDKWIVEIKGNHMWYHEDLKNGKIEAKNNAAQIYAQQQNKKFLFLLNYTFGSSVGSYDVL